MRAYRRAPFAALTIVATIAVGLATVGTIFTIYNALFLRPDAVRAPEELFTVTRYMTPAGGAAWLNFTPRELDLLRKGTDGIFSEMTGRDQFEVRAQIEGHPTNGTFVSGNFFQVLGARPHAGRALLPSDDIRGAGRVAIVLSFRGWKRLFAGEPALGRRIRINGAACEIVGVMPKRFRGLAVSAPDYWAPFAAAADLRASTTGRGIGSRLRAIGRLRPELSPDAAQSALGFWFTRQADVPTTNQGPLFIRMAPRFGVYSETILETMKVYASIFFSFGLVLMIGCANVANLLIARGIARQREIGIRLSLGASRGRIVRQLLTESVLLALVAATAAIALVRLALMAINQVTTTTFPAGLGGGSGWIATALDAPPVDLRVVIFMVTGALVSVAAFGLLPALQTSRFELVRTARGEFVKDARPGRARQILMVAQVAAATWLLICAGIFLRGAWNAATEDSGIRVSDALKVVIGDETRRVPVLTELRADTAVIDIAAAAPEVFAQADGTAIDALPDGRNGASSNRGYTTYQFVSPNYFQTIGIPLVNGRMFDITERTPDAGVVVVSDVLAQRLWGHDNPLGRSVRPQVSPPRQQNQGPMPLASGASAASGPFEEDQGTDQRTSQPRSRSYTVVGIVKHVGSRGQLIGGFEGAGVYLPISPEAWGTSWVVRVRGDAQQQRRALLTRFTGSADGGIQIVALRTLVGLQAYVMWVAFWIVMAIGGLALMLTLTGLFSVLSYVVAQRTNEIGIRIALGATAFSITRMVLSQASRALVVGVTIGAGLAAALATLLMTTPLASELGRVLRVFDPPVYGGVIALVVVASALAAALPAVRAARLDAAVTLRQE